MAEGNNYPTHVDCNRCREDSNRNIQDLSQETTQYLNLVTLIGSSSDTEFLREQLRQSRKRAYELAKYGRLKQLPMLRSFIGQGIRSEDYEYLGTLLTSAMELLILYLCKTVTLLERFNLSNRDLVLIKTGMSEIKQEKCRFNVNAVGDKPVATTTMEEINSVIRNIQSLRVMVRDIYETVDFKPWNAEPRFSITDISEDPMEYPRLGNDPHLISVRSSKLMKSRRCKCFVIVIICVAITLTLIVGLAIGLTV